LQRDRALLRTTPGSELTHGNMGVIPFLLLHPRSLQHAATHGNTATRCNILQHAATCCSTLHHAATRCDTPQYAVTRCNTKVQVAVISSLLLHSVAGTYLKHILWSFFLRMCDMTHSQQGEALKHSCMWHDDKHPLIHMCDMIRATWEALTQSYVWYGTHSFICVTRLFQSAENHSYVRHEDSNTSMYILTRICIYIYAYPKASSTLSLSVIGTQRPLLQLRVCMARIYYRHFGKNIVSFIGLFCKRDLSF